MRRAAGILAASLLAAAPAATAAAPKPQKSTLTAAGMAAASRALLTASDLGANWRQATQASDSPIDDCGAPDPAGVVEIGKTASPTFSAGSNGPFVSQGVFVYATPAQALRVWEAVSGMAARTCLVQSVNAGSTQTLTLKVIHTSRLSLPVSGARSSGYRVVARVRTKQLTATAYVDLVLVARGNAIAEVSYSSFSQPLDRPLELSVTRLLSRRL